MNDSKKTFEEIFGFEPRMNDWWKIEQAIILAKLTEFADTFRSQQDEAEKLTAKYPENVPAKDLKQAISDLATMNATAKKREDALNGWREAVKAANDKGYALTDKIESYFSPPSTAAVK